MTITAEQATEILGARPWNPTNGPTRHYINDWAQYIGLDVHFYKTGNISYASINGEKISNSRAYKICSAKVWIQDGTIWTQAFDADLIDDLRANIKARVAASVTTTCTASEAAAKLGVSVRTIQRRAAGGKLAAVKTNGRWAITL